MEIKQYSKEIKRSLAECGGLWEDNLHMLFGMFTEIGELADVFKKQHAYKKQIDWINVREEIGDILWYVINFCNINSFDIEEILDKNVEKLKARYPEKFTEHFANNRDLKNERKILENKEDSARNIDRWS